MTKVNDWLSPILTRYTFFDKSLILTGNNKTVKEKYITLKGKLGSYKKVDKEKFTF